MKEIFINLFTKSAGITMGVFFGLMGSSLLAVTITGVINTFSAGDELTAAKINENFTSLKDAIQGIPEHHIARVYRSSPFSLGDMQPISFESEEYDTGGFWSPSDPTKLIAPESGYYFVNMHLYANRANGNTMIRKNGSVWLAYCAHDTNKPCSSTVQLNAGEYVDIAAYGSLSGNPGSLTQDFFVEIFRIK